MSFHGGVRLRATQAWFPYCGAAWSLFNYAVIDLGGMKMPFWGDHPHPARTPWMLKAFWSTLPQSRRGGGETFRMDGHSVEEKLV